MTRQERIAAELDVLQNMLATEKKLRDKLVELGQPEGFKTVKMQYFEKQIASRRKELGGECESANT